jgi:hypothetical protein
MISEQCNLQIINLAFDLHYDPNASVLAENTSFHYFFYVYHIYQIMVK